MSLALHLCPLSCLKTIVDCEHFGRLDAQCSSRSVHHACRRGAVRFPTATTTSAPAATTATATSSYDATEDRLAKVRQKEQSRWLRPSSGLE